jgi:hypothetical protein
MSTGSSFTDGIVTNQSKRLILINLPIFMSLFVFYYIFVFGTLPEYDMSGNLVTAQAIFLFTIALTLLLVSYLHFNLERKHITIFSLALMVTLFSFLIKAAFPYVLLPIILAGVFFGISQLAYYKVFWTTTDGVKRSRIAGITRFLSP